MSKPTLFQSALSRRRFIQLSSLAAGATLLPGCITRPKANYKSPSEKLNIAIIGAGGKGASDTDGVASENIVALCDIDANTLRERGQKYPKARHWRDYRKMLEEQKDIDAVVVSTPDHHHAPASMMAIKLGKHVYCQKPLTHSVYEARMLTKAAKEYGVATLMGNQGHSGEGARAFCELIWSGAIGSVTEVHAWTDRPIWPQGIGRPSGSQPVPAHVDWDLFLGPAPFRPYHSGYHPFAWRGWWDFGTGALGDMGCHVLDAVNWALKLGHPLSVEAESSDVNNETAPAWSIVRYVFPARGNMPALKLFWYDGNKKPAAELLGMKDTKDVPANGCLVIGTKGKLTTETYGGNPKPTADSATKEFIIPAKTLPRSPGHYEEWIQACKGGPKTGATFEYAGPFTEWVLLGNLAVRANKRIEWDGPNMRAKNAPEVAEFIRRQYRPGWSL